MTTADLAVPTVHCNACKLNIEEALAEVPGVDAATVDMAAKSVRVEYDPSTVDNETIAAAIEDAGYPVSRVRTVELPMNGQRPSAIEPAE